MTSTSTINRLAAEPAKKTTVKLKVGSRIRALESVVSPDFPDVSFAGWTGRIVEMSGKKPPFKYFIEWDEPVVSGMPRSYVERCEQQQIYFRWACLNDADFEAVE